MQAHEEKTKFWQRRTPCRSRFQSGEFEPFKMLIGAIMALLVLVIILSAIEFFENFQVTISTERFYTGLSTAVKQPNGKTLKMENLQFAPNTILTTSSVSRSVGLSEECLEFVAPQNRSSIISNNPSSIHVTTQLELDAFAVCYTNEFNEFPDTCQVGCRVGFGVEPEN